MLVLPVSMLAQAEKKLQAKNRGKEESKVSDSDAAAAERRAFAISLITSLADQARSYGDLALRSRVLARAADTLWDTPRKIQRDYCSAGRGTPRRRGTLKI